MPRIVISLFILFTVFGTLLGTNTHTASADSAVFTIENVKVDITSDNAVKSREQAFPLAQQKAFKILAKRLLDESQIASFEMPDASYIDTLVKDFEITDERVSPVRYIGTYTFRFKENDTRSYFRGSGIGYTDVKSRPVLILPFYSYGARTVLWGPGNDWMTAWRESIQTDGLVPVVVPLGDLEDVRDVNNNQALDYQTEELVSIVNRYGAGEAVIMLALPQWALSPSDSNPDINRDPDSLTVMFYRTDLGTPDLVTQIFVTKNDIQDGETIFSAGVRASVKALQNDWKKRTSIVAGTDNALQARIQYNSMEQWIETQKKLRTVQGINNIKILKITPTMATIEIAFSGTEQRLRLALAQSDMTLTAPQLSMYGNNNASGYGFFNRRSTGLVYNLYLNKFYR